MIGASVNGRIASLCRHPVKGFTPEHLDSADLAAGGFFPCDRLYAVENGPSGFDPDGRGAFAAWLTEFLGAAVDGPLKVVWGPGHRFTDHPEGYVSIVNLASVRDLESRVGRPIDPLRFRANLYVEGWPAWVENEMVDREVAVGAARAKVFKSITRCAATGVDPTSGERDMEIPRALLDHYGHVFCGVYVRVLEGGRVARGDPAVL